MSFKTPTLELTEKFIKGLDDFGLTIDEIKNNWKYCGGNKGRHLNYFKLCCKNEEIPEIVNKCVCGHDIQENCYITNDISILILGNCCIKKFIPKSSRTCETCNKPHKNRKINKCNDCRRNRCEICRKECDYKYKRCYGCFYK